MAMLVSGSVTRFPRAVLRRPCPESRCEHPRQLKMLELNPPTDWLKGFADKRVVKHQNTYQPRTSGSLSATGIEIYDMPWKNHHVNMVVPGWKIPDISLTFPDFAGWWSLTTFDLYIFATLLLRFRSTKVFFVFRRGRLWQIFVFL